MRGSRQWGGLLAGVAVVAALAGCQPPPPDLVVTKTADTNDGRCDADCSLREAVVAANARAGRDTIRVPAGVFALTRSGADEDRSGSGDLDLTGELLVLGAGTGSTVIDGRGGDRGLDVVAGSAEVRGLTVRGGFVSDRGGGIRNQASLRLVDVAVRDNDAVAGGGISSVRFDDVPVSLTLVRTVVDGNTNAEEGAGIDSRGQLRVVDSQITGNSGGPGAGGGINTTGDAFILDSDISGNGTTSGICGGGISNGGTLEIRGSTISNNRAESGGAIRNTGNLKVVASAVERNEARITGGGIHNDGGNVLLEEVTVVGNRAGDPEATSNDCGAGSSPPDGGGLFSTGAFSLLGSTVAYNTDLSGGAPDCSGTYRDLGGNTVGNRQGCTLTRP